MKNPIKYLILSVLIAGCSESIDPVCSYPENPLDIIPDATEKGLTNDNYRYIQYKWNCMDGKERIIQYTQIDSIHCKWSRIEGFGICK
jgi:hypothetical protein